MFRAFAALVLLSQVSLVLRPQGRLERRGATYLGEDGGLACCCVPTSHCYPLRDYRRIHFKDDPAPCVDGGLAGSAQGNSIYRDAAVVISIFRVSRVETRYTKCWHCDLWLLPVMCSILCTTSHDTGYAACVNASRDASRCIIAGGTCATGTMQSLTLDEGWQK
jgi:hypothetical protein